MPAQMTIGERVQLTSGELGSRREQTTRRMIEIAVTLEGELVISSLFTVNQGKG